MSFEAPVTKDIALCADHVLAGRVVGVPTGTSYALAASALQGWALQRLRTLKARPAEKTFTVFMAPRLWTDYFVLSPDEQRVLKAMENSPLTLLVAPGPELMHLARGGRVGLRIIDHPLMAQFAEQVGVPVTATSANRSGNPPLYAPGDVASQFPGLLPDELLGEADPRGASGTTYDLSLAAVLDGGELTHGKMTTIASVQDGHISIVRQGAITVETLQTAVLPG